MKQQLRTTIQQIDGDLLTPILLFQRLQGEQKFLYESSAKHDAAGRYSFIGANPRKTYKGAGTTLTEIVHATGKTYSYEGDLVALLKQVMPRISNVAEFPFTGGAIGYIRFNRNESTIPAVNFQVYETLIIYDHLTEKITLIHTNIDAEKQPSNLQQVIDQITKATPIDLTEAEASPFTDSLTAENLQAILAEANSVVANNGLTSITFAKKQHVQLQGTAFNYYRQLRVAKPSPYMYYMEFNDHIVVGTSPNSIISVANGQVRTTTSGIEHIADSSKPITKNSDGVHEATLHPSFHAIDVLTQLLPTDAACGAPKEVALQTIVQIEPEERNLFGGAIGYIGFNGQIDFAAADDALLVQGQQITKEVGETISAVAKVLGGH